MSYQINSNRNPTLDENGIWSGFHWPLYTPHKKEYLTLATNSTAIGRGPRTQKCAFWQKYLPKLMKESGMLCFNEQLESFFNIL